MHFDYLTWFFRKFNAFILAVFVLLIPLSKIRQPLHFDADHSADKTNYPFVMIHGFQSWNEDAPNNAYEGMQYWGMLNGDALAAYREAGFTCVAPMVDPSGSNWHRVCELYAKLTGKRVDYGEAHSKKHNHERYGEDYTGKAMLEHWDSMHKINVIGHSLGGKDAILFTSLMAKGSDAEKNMTTDGTLSDLFSGGKADWIYSCTGLAAVYNGTTLFVNHQAVRESRDYIKARLDAVKLVPGKAKKVLGGFVDSISHIMENIASGTVANPDTAVYDMHPDNAVAMNKEIATVENVYYFSHVQDNTKPSRLDGRLIADPRVSDPIIGALAPIIARTNTVTEGGLVLDEAWQPNDGCANVISQISPFGAPTLNLTAAPSAETARQAKPGVYNVLPTVRASHMWPIGDFVFPNTDGPVYLMHMMEMINAL